SIPTAPIPPVTQPNTTHIRQYTRRIAATRSGDDAPIKRRSIDEGEAASKRISDDSKELAKVLTSIDAATVLAGGIDVPNGSGSIPTAGPPVVDIPTGSKVVPTAKVARIHAEEELQGMIDSLDRTNETIAKYLQEYQDFASELPLERRIELISDLVKYQDNYSKIYKFQSQQRRPWTKKQKNDYYMTVIRNNLGWKDYPLRKGLALVMICYKLQVENFS
nr:hypothetical protein [Tanacetum cinerariifolium]